MVYLRLNPTWSALAIEGYYRGAWVPVCDVSDAEFDRYLDERPAAYRAAELSLQETMSKTASAGDAQMLELNEAELIIFEDWKHNTARGRAAA